MQDLKTYKAEDKAVEGRSQNYLQEWEKNKPVEGALRPDAALQKLAIFESKYSRLEEERDNVSKADEALTWENKLNRINALFDVWINVQRRWRASSVALLTSRHCFLWRQAGSCP